MQHKPVKFFEALLRWYRAEGRHDLPWQLHKSPYRVWVSEIMLQQTQVKTVIPYFQRFTNSFPDIKCLANASLDDVLSHWSGLGYYARARNLHKAARIIMDEHEGRIPDNIELLMNLPGIGRSTAGAILALSYNQSHPIADGNVKRVLARLHVIEGDPSTTSFNKRIWQLAEQYTPTINPAEYTQAIMDLGATICLRSKPNCDNCPVDSFCQARQRDQVNLYPSRIKKRGRPTKNTIFTILQSTRGEVLLEQRPPTGIWGGLWSFPECDAETRDVNTWIMEHFGFKVTNINFGEQLKHTFSHFDLNITPVYAKVIDSRVAIRDGAKFQWLQPSTNINLGLAQPVRQLLENLQSGQTREIQ